jgi:integrase
VPAGEIENWLNDELASGLAPSSVHRHYRTLRRMLQVAVEKQKILRNPCDHVDPPRVPRRDMVFLDWDQALRLAEAHTVRFRALIYLAVDSGMRWGELVGLRRSRIDLARRKVRVTEQLTQLEDYSWVRQPPKTTAGIRSITMSAFTAEILRDHVARFAVPGPDGLVFPNAAGNPISSSSFRSLRFGRALQAGGFSWRFHDPRHTSVALAIAAGAHPKAIQTRMGHASITITLDRYGHLFPELDEAIAEEFGRQLVDAQRRRENNVIPLPL